MAGPRIPGKLRAVPVSVDPDSSNPTTETQALEENSVRLPDVAPLGQVRFEPPPALDLPDKPSGLEQVYGDVVTRDPARAAKVVDLARKMQEPEAFIDKNFDNAVKMDAAPQSSFFAELEKSYPGTAKYLSDPAKMSGIHDDLQNLAQHEGLANGMKQASGVLEAAQAGFQQSAIGLTQRLAQGEGAPDIMVSPEAPLVERLVSQVATLAGDAPLMIAGTIGGGVAGSAAGPVGSALGGFAGGNALPAAYRTAFLEKYRMGGFKSSDDILNWSYAVLKEATKQGFVGLLAGGAGQVAGRLVAPIASQGLKTAAPAAAEVVTMTTAGAAVEGELPRSTDFLDAALLVGGIHAASRFGGNAIGYYVAERKASKAREFYLAMGATAEASKLRERLPAEHRAYIEAIVKDGPVQDIYVPVEAIDRVFGATDIARPEGIRQPTVEQIMNQVGIAEAYREAKISGGDVKIPLGQWVEKVVGTEYYQKLADDVKFSPESLTVNQVLDVQKEVEARAAEIQKSAEVTAKVEESSAAVRENIERQLTEAGLTKEEIANDPRLHEAFYRTLGETLGEDPLALSQQFPLTVGREIEGQTFAQGSRGDWKAEGIKLSAGPYDLAENQTFNPKKNQFTITATDKSGAEIGYASFQHVDGGYIEAISVQVKPEHQRKGVASAMYDMAESLSGRPTSPSTDQTTMSKAFWDDRSKTLSQGGDQPRGRIQIQGQRFNIDLLKNADKSTFIHETGHYFLEVTKNIAERENAPERVKKDYATIREWVGAKEGETLTVDQHEKFARGFEKYLAEGKAPSAALERAFSTFKRWLTKIYRDLRGLNVELTDDVRAVFDRMLATDAEITAAQRDAGYVSELNQQIPESVRGKIQDMQLKAREIAEKQLLGEQMKELTAAHREKLASERAKATKDAEEKVDGLPLFNAQAEVVSSVGTEKKALADAQRLLDGKLKDTTAFEVAAEKNGIADGASLARQMIEARDTNLRARSIDALVTEAMAPFADLKDTQKIRERAMEAIHNERATELLALERAAFQELLDKKLVRTEVVRRNRLEARIEAQAAKEYARRSLSEKSVKDATKPSIYVTAERNAAVKAERAIRSGDLEAAVEYKRQQMVNHALAAEAMRNKVEAEKAYEYFKPFEKRGTDLMNMPYGTIRQVDALLAKYGLGPARSEDTTGLRATATTMLAAGESPAEIANRTGLTLDAGGSFVSESLPQFVARVNDNYFSLSIPDAVQQVVQKAPGDMKMQELRDLRSAVKSIAEVGRKYERFLGSFETADIREAARQFRAQVEKNVGTPYLEAKAIGFKNDSQWGDKIDAITNLPDAVVPELVNILTLCHYLDRATEGKAKDFIYRPLKAAEDRKLVRYQKMTKEVNDLFSKFYKPEELAEYKSKREFYPEVQRNLTRENVLMMAMNWGNEGNRQRLKEGLGLRDEQVHSMFERVLEKRDWDFAQAVWDHLETYWPDVQALEMRVRGEQVQKVDAAEVVNAHGTYRGGYFPLAYDFLKSSEAYKNVEKKNELYKQYSATVAHTETGHTKARAAYVKRPVLLDMQVLFNHLENVVHDLEFREAVIDVNRFLNQPDTRNALENSIGIRATKGINDWLKSVAADQGEFATMGDKAFRWFRFGTTFATLGYRFPMVPLDLVGNVIRSSGEIGFKRTTTAIRDFLANPTETKQFVDELSPRMKQRATLRDRDISDISKKWSGKDSAVKQFAFMFQSFADEAISYPVWADVYKKAVSEHGHERAVNIADETIVRTFGSGSMLDRVGVQRGSEASKIMSMYYSFSSMMFNRAWLSGKLAGLEYNQGNVGGAIGIAAKAAFFAWGLEGLNEALYKEFIRNPISGQADDDEQAKRISARLLTQPFSYVWGVRDIAAFGVERALGNKTQKYRLSPLESTVETLLGTAGDTVNIAFSDRQVDDRYIENLARSSAIVLGYPQQANTLVFNLLDWAEGEGELTWRDALSRKTKK